MSVFQVRERQQKEVQVKPEAEKSSHNNRHEKICTKCNTTTSAAFGKGYKNGGLCKECNNKMSLGTCKGCNKTSSIAFSKSFKNFGLCKVCNAERLAEEMRSHICKNCNVTGSKKFSMSYKNTGLCKDCNGERLEEMRLAACQRKEDFNKALLEAEIFLLDIPPENVLFVSTIMNLLAFEKALPYCTLAGIDTETRPNFRAGKFNPTSTLQVALRCITDGVTTEFVYIIDLRSLSCYSDSRRVLSRVLHSFFGRPNILILGQGLMNDMREVVKSYHSMLFAKHDSILLPMVLEMSDLHYLYKSSIETTELVSLQRMTLEHLNKHLKKSKKLTLSNWDARPLHASQIHYAACDALVLLRLYDYFTSNISANGDVISEETISSLLRELSFDKDGMDREQKAR